MNQICLYRAFRVAKSSQQISDERESENLTAFFGSCRFSAMYFCKSTVGKMLLDLTAYFLHTLGRLLLMHHILSSTRPINQCVASSPEAYA